MGRSKQLYSIIYFFLRNITYLLFLLHFLCWRQTMGCNGWEKVQEMLLEWLLQEMLSTHQVQGAACIWQILKVIRGKKSFTGLPISSMHYKATLTFTADSVYLCNTSTIWQFWKILFLTWTKLLEITMVQEYIF